MAGADAAIFGLPRLKDSLLVVVDCSTLTARQREDLFMSSRDRLSKNPIRYELEQEIEQLLRENPELRKLQNQRRQQDVESKLSEEKPLEEVLGKVLKASPSLNTLFLKGRRLSRPFGGGAGGGNGQGAGPNDDEDDFVGKRHPSFFKFKDVDYGKELIRHCEVGRRCRIVFETDVENGYFDRASDCGSNEVEIIESSREMSPPSYNLTLDAGRAYLNMALPPEASAGDTIVLQVTVNDPTLNDPFINVARLSVAAKQQRPGGPSTKRKPKGGGTGDGKSNQGIALPEVITVKEGDDNWRKHNFDNEVACHVISDPVGDGDEPQLVHTFYINVDNTSLTTEMKYSKQDARLLEAKFKYGNVLLGLAMLHGENGDEESDSSDDNTSDKESVQERIRRVTSAVAPVLLPMIDQLSGLSEDDLEAYGEVGDDD